MDEQTLFERVRKATAEVLRIDVEKITMESRLREDLGADSLDLVSLLMMLDEELGTTLPDEREEKITTVGDAVRFVNKHLNAAA
ncbi:MAG: acyl carrier protein [Chitinispirillaceae bacterium]|nr:acyl carrier protein [Chitinispirillaceae bacterium]